MAIIIQDTFTMTDPTSGLTFSSAITLPQDQYQALSSDELQALKQAQFGAWVMLINTPADPANQPSIDDQIATTAQQLSDTTAQLVSLNQQAETPPLTDEQTSQLTDTVQTVVQTVAGGDD